MTYAHILKKTKLDETNNLIEEYYFFEVLIDELGLSSSNMYLQNIKDQYYVYPYMIQLSQIISKQVDDDFSNIDNLLDKDKYYLCHHKNTWGFKKPFEKFITICDLDQSRSHDEKMFWNPKMKLINLLFKENLIK